MASTSAPIHFSPQEVLPFPKAGPRLNARRGRKKRKTAILTDTPEKLEIELEFQNRNKAKKKVLAIKSSSRQNKKKGKKLIRKTSESDTSSNGDKDDCLCLVCLEWFSRSCGGEKWV